MYNNPQQGGGPQGGRAPKKSVTNEWKGEGIVKPRSGNDQDPIKFFPFPSGGGAIHITVEVQELSGTDPQTGQPRYTTTFVPVNITTNRVITQQLLQTICPGMRVRIVGSLRYKSFTSKKTGQQSGSIEVNAFVCEILSAPQQQPAYPSQQPAYGGYPQQGAAPVYGAPQQGGYPAQGGAPAYGGQPAYPPQPGYPQQPPQGGYAAPAYPQQPVQPAYGAPVQPAPQYTPKQGQQGARPAQPAPPYYQPPTQPAGADNDDMPPDDAPPVRPINV